MYQFRLVRSLISGRAAFVRLLRRRQRPRGAEPCQGQRFHPSFLGSARLPCITHHFVKRGLHCRDHASGPQARRLLRGSGALPYVAVLRPPRARFGALCYPVNDDREQGRSEGKQCVRLLPVCTQVLFALTLAIFYFDEIMDDYYYSSGRALPGEPWAVPIRLVLIYFLAMCGTIALATAICSLNELVHVIPGVGFLVDILGLSLMGAEFGAATAGIRALPTPSPRAFSVEDGFSPNSKVAYLKEPPDSQVF